MRPYALLVGWLGLTLATVCIVAPVSMLGADRDLLIIRGYAFAACWFALAANYPVRMEKKP